MSVLYKASRIKGARGAGRAEGLQSIGEEKRETCLFQTEMERRGMSSEPRGGPALAEERQKQSAPTAAPRAGTKS